MYVERMARARRRMEELGVEVLLLSVGADLPYLTGYEAMPLERLTMLVLPRHGDATLVVPRLEAPRVEERPEAFGVRAWEETEDPVAVVASMIGSPAEVAIGDRTWARFLIELQSRLPSTTFRRADEVLMPLRAVKDGPEIDALRRAAAAADRVIQQIQRGDVALVGRSEADVADEVRRRLVAEGHQRANFAIVGSGPNAASPHHEPGSRRIQHGDVVLFDIGGTLDGYCSDITRCVWTGEPPEEFAEMYRVLAEAQSAAVGAAAAGTPAEDVDATARGIIAGAGFGARFIHRTGHGIGMEEHEDPYIVSGNAAPLEVGNAFSIEPGIYFEGRWGARIEDIVVVTELGPESLNHASHELVALEA